jgi:signal peptidase I
MNINFPLILVIVVLASGLVALIDKLFFARKRASDAPRPGFIDACYSLFPILLLVLVIRSFLVEPFHIPSGSLKPTLLTGDLILVNKYDYGLRLPVLDTKILKVSEPKLGDIVVFHWPVNPSIDFIKRVIGVPGDRISYINKVLYVNGQKASQQLIGYAVDSNDSGPVWTVQKLQENLLGIQHDIYINPQQPAIDFTDLVVPKGQYFVMGDNRDDSEDSRYWGFVPEKYLVGKAFLIWLSWDSNNWRVRWSRIGHRIG